MHDIIIEKTVSYPDKVKYRKEYKKYLDFKKALKVIVKINNNRVFVKESKYLIRLLKENLYKLNKTDYKLVVKSKRFGITKTYSTSKPITYDTTKQIINTVKKERRVILNRSDNKLVPTKTTYYTRNSRFDRSHAYDLYDGVRIEKGTILAYYNHLKKVIFNTSCKPKDDKKYIGVELEFLSELNKTELSELFYEKAIHLGKKIEVKTDGSVYDVSLNGIDFKGLEICILDTEDNIQDTVGEVIEVIKENSWLVTSRCGLHVHLDMRNRDVNKAYYNLRTFQTLMYRMQPVSRKRGSYSSISTGKKDFRTSCRSSTTRYKGINVESFRKFKTLEVRMHSGTLNSNKINGWIDFLINITDLDKEVKRCPSATNTIFKHLDKLLPTTKQYVVDRIETFKQEHAA